MKNPDIKTVKSKSKQVFLLSSLLHAVYWVDESLQSSMEASGLRGIPRSWSMVLVNVADGITRPIKLAENIGVSRQAMHKILEQMENEGFIEIAQDPHDRRAKIVDFNSRARHLQRAALTLLAQIETQLASRIGKEELRALKVILDSDWGPLVVSKINIAK